MRRSVFKPVLPAHLKGLAKVPPSPHVELFGDNLPTRLKELNEEAALAASLGKPPEKPSEWSSYQNRRPYQRRTPYSRPPTATQSSLKTNWSQRSQNQVAQPPVKGQQKVCIPHVTLTFHPLRTIAACFRMWTLLTRDPNVLHIISQGVCLDFASTPPPPQGTGPLFTNLVSPPPKRLLLMRRLSLSFAYRLLLLPLWLLVCGFHPSLPC